MTSPRSSRVVHLSCGTLQRPSSPKAVCHCLLLEDDAGLALIDTGIGLLDVARPTERLGQALIDQAGFQFEEAATAARQLEGRGWAREALTDVVMTHLDPDHTGGLADFPAAAVHVAAAELDAMRRAGWRYVPSHFAHAPRWRAHAAQPTRAWFGRDAIPVPLGFASEVLLVPLPGHTLGHCGVAVSQGTRWLLHVGDAYYLRVETQVDDHPVSALAASVAEDDAARRTSLEWIRRLMREHGDAIDVFGYHDPSELPPDGT